MRVTIDHAALDWLLTQFTAEPCEFGMESARRALPITLDTDPEKNLPRAIAMFDKRRADNCCMCTDCTFFTVTRDQPIDWNWTFKRLQHPDLRNWTDPQVVISDAGKIAQYLAILADVIATRWTPSGEP